jgi:uncharacterized protein YdhG (YjbR/CyaY superfamily)
MKMRNKIETIDQYIKSFSPDIRKILTKVRQTIRQIAPRAEESISYGIPTFKINGRPLVYFAGFKKHISIYPIKQGKDVIKQLAPYVKGKGTAQFQLSEPIPYNLIKKFVEYRMKESKKE